MFSERYENALVLAAVRHDGQRRKGGELPYLTHLVHVGRILEPYGEDAVIAGLLHDLLEDTCKSPEEIASVSAQIEAEFGDEVLEAVRAVSEEKVHADGAKIPWRERKEHYLAHLEHGPFLALLVSAADKIHNVATLTSELDEKGPTVWKRFRASAEESMWFFDSVCTAIALRLGNNHPLVGELSERISSLRARAES